MTKPMQSFKTTSTAVDVTLVSPAQFQAMANDSTPATDRLRQLFADRKARLASK